MPKATGTPSTSLFSNDSRVSESVQFDTIGHFVKQTEDKKKKMCAGKDFKLIIRTMCKKCCVGLCIDCFIPFHSR